MNVIILMAGEGSRLKEVGYPLPKPFIEVGDKHILEWTTRSLPFISHYGEKQADEKGHDFFGPGKGINLYFAVRTEHEEKFQIVSRLKKIYGENITVKFFDKLTRGNLETAYITCQEVNNDDEIIFLDSDNHYDGSNFLNFLSMYKDIVPHFATICYFEPFDNSHKWCFALLKGNAVQGLLEKDEKALSLGGKPMVGVFYYNTKNLFLKAARFTLNQSEMVGGEFYMSQSIKCLIDNGIPVFGLKVKNVKPLGTPEDIIKVREKEYENMY